MQSATKRPVNALTLKLQAVGTHKLSYGAPPNRTAEATGGLRWEVALPAAPLAWPTSPEKGDQLERSLAGALKASGTFTEKGTAPLTPPNPPSDPFTCTGNVQFSQSVPVLRRVGTALAKGVGFTVTVPSFSSFGVGPRYLCTPSNASPLYFGNNMDGPASGRFTISQATLAQSVAKLPVSGGVSSISCGGSASPPCTQSLAWTGTVTLEKTCRNGAAGSIRGILRDPGISCSSPCKGAGCDPPVLGVPVPKQIIKVKSGNTVKVKVECYGGRACSGRSKIIEFAPGRGTTAARRPTLGSGTFKVKAGRRKTLRLKLTKAGRRRLKKGKTTFVSIKFSLSGKKVGERRTTLPTRVRR